MASPISSPWAAKAWSEGGTPGGIGVGHNGKCHGGQDLRTLLDTDHMGLAAERAHLVLPPEGVKVSGKKKPCCASKVGKKITAAWERE